MSPKNILICEDNALILDVLCQALRISGLVVSGFASADEAMNELGTDLGKFDAIVTDYEMPGTKGDRFARQIRSMNSTAQIIVISGSYRPGSAERALNIQFLAKPFSSSDLLKRLSESGSQPGIESGVPDDSGGPLPHIPD